MADDSRKINYTNSGQAGKSGNFQVVEAYKSIRTNLQYTLGEAKKKIVIITSAEPNAGKSVTSANLSISLVQTSCKVLLIDADMRKPTQHKLFRIENGDGLSKVLSGQLTAKECIHYNAVPGLDVLPSGSIPPNPSELLGSERMNNLISEMSEIYDYVFIDTPPVNMVSDALTIMNLAAGAVVITRQKYTVYAEAQHAIETIKNVGGNVLGTIITDVRESNKPYSSYGGKYGYYKYRSYNYEYRKQGK